MWKRPIKTKPVPYCPICGAQMCLRRPRQDQTWQPFWGCSQYPDCRGTRNIGPDGRPETDEEDEENWEEVDDWDDGRYHPYHPSNRGDQ